MFKKILIAFSLTLLTLIVLISATGAYLIVTPWGGKLLVRYFKKRFSCEGQMHIGRYDGSLQNGFTLKDVYVKQLPFMPRAVLRLQEVHVQLSFRKLLYPDIKIFNARIFLPDSDPLVFTGEIHDNKVKGDFYAMSVDLQEAARLLDIGDIRKDIQGFISNMDVSVQGPLSSPRIEGNLGLDSVRYKSVSLTNALLRVYLTLLPDDGQFQIKGDVFIDSGLVRVRKTNLQVEQSKLSLPGDVFNPVLDLRLSSKVEDMDFHLAIKGTMSYPQVSVSSDPPMPSQQALLVLFTGNAVASSTSPFKGVPSSQLSDNFLDYSLQDGNLERQLGIKTKLTENLKLGVEIDRMPGPPGETSSTYYSRKINGEMDVNKYMSLNVSTEVLPQNDYPPSSYQSAQSQPETEVYLQYKKRF